MGIKGLGKSAPGVVEHDGQVLLSHSFLPAVKRSMCLIGMLVLECFVEE